MSNVGQLERKTQNRVVQFFKDYLKYGFKKHSLDTENMSKLSVYQILYMYNFSIHFNHSKSIPLEIVNETPLIAIEAFSSKYFE